ncbi:hypothetical protein DITRI_Ditri04bG0188900 [Diplodiscus trichospermus]
MSYRSSKISEIYTACSLHIENESFLPIIRGAAKRSGSDHKYESADFEADGYQLKLVLYPYGNEKRNGNGHISLFLAISDKNLFLSSGWEVNVTYTFFVFNHVHDNYLVIPDGSMRRFHGLNTEYELLVIKASGKGEMFSVVKDPENNIFTWKLENYSTLLNDMPIYSEVFTAGLCQWKLSVYPKGDKRAKRSLSFFLRLHSSASISVRRKVYVQFKLSIKNQIGRGHHERTDRVWLSDSVISWGFVNFISLKDLEDTSKGFVVNDTLITEAEITAISQVKYEV